MSTRTFSRNWLDRHYITLDLNNPRVVQRSEISQQEWGTVYEVVVKGDDEKFWQMTYREADLGEIEVDPWYDEEQVSATEVAPVATLSTTWVPVASISTPAPAPVCRHLTAYGEGTDCRSLAVWAVAYLTGGQPRRTDLCEEHLRDALRIRKDLVDIRETKRW